MSEVDNQPRCDVRSLLCLLCCIKHAKGIDGLGAFPRKISKVHTLRLILVEFLHSRTSEVSTNFLNFIGLRKSKVIVSQLDCKHFQNIATLAYVKSYTFQFIMILQIVINKSCNHT